MKNKTLWLAFVLWGAAAPCLAGEPAWQFSREVKAPPLKQEELLTIVLDSDVFAATQNGLQDVRLLDRDGHAIPYLLRMVRTTRARTERTTWTVRQIGAQPRKDGGFQITVELGEKDPHPNGLSLISPLRNFKQRVRVSTSVDGKQWAAAGNETVIFDYSRYMDVRNDSVPFPETSRRHFRIVIDDVTLEQESELLAFTRRLRGAEEVERTEQVTVDRRPFRIERVDFWREVKLAQATGDEKAKYPVAGHRVELDEKKQQTIIQVDTRREPLTFLELETPDRNFSRHAVVEAETVQGVTKSWQKIGDGVLSRVDFKNLKREDLSISFPETRQAKYRIVIDNRDSPPLKVAGIKAEGDVYEVVYLAAPDKQYHLIYGATDAEPAIYDTAAIQELLQKGFQPARAELGLPGQGTGTPAGFKSSSLLKNPLFFGGIILLLVIALGWGLYRATKRMDTMPE